MAKQKSDPQKKPSGTSRKKPSGRTASKPSSKPKASGAGRRKQSTSSGKKKQPEGGSLMRGILWALVLIGLVGGTGVVVHYLFPPEPSGSSDSVQPEPVINKPQYEVFSEDTPDTEPPAEVVLPMPPRPDRLPEVAIIIDDIGYRRKIAEQLVELDSRITFSVLPNSPHCREIAEYAHQNGVQIMLHLPMEPMEYPKADPGPGALFSTMATDDMLALLNDHIDRVPHVVGVNNHMGSRLTTVSTRMYQIFTVLKKRELFFIDSRTSAQSLCKPSARLLQLPYAERDVFLDHRQTEAFVRRQVELLVKTAVEQGSAIGIGHPHKVTYDVLAETLPEIKKRVRLVRASALVKMPGGGGSE